MSAFGYGRQSSGMSASDQRKLFGIIVMVIGFGVLLWGLGNAESDYNRLNSTQLAAKTLTEIIAPDITAIGIGLFLFVVGIIIFFASSNKDASKGVQRLFGKRR